MQFEAVGFPKGLLENRAGNFETDEVVIAVRSVAFPRDFENVKTKFRLHVRKLVVLKQNAVAVFLPQPRIQNRNGSVGADAMTVVVRGVVRERADGESVLGYIFCVSQQRLDEITAADVMREVAEKRAAVRVVAHILNDGSAISVGLRPAQILLGCRREFFQEERLDVHLPSGIDDGLMREDSVGVNGSRQRQQNGDQANNNHAGASKLAMHDSI